MGNFDTPFFYVWLNGVCAWKQRACEDTRPKQGRGIHPGRGCASCGSTDSIQTPGRASAVVRRLFFFRPGLHKRNIT
jgi:hypothetical protein